MSNVPVDDPYLPVAIEAALRASAVHEERFRDVEDVEYKSPQQLVTDADREAEQCVKRYLLEAFPQHAFVGEESGRERDAEHVWHVDPIDGTTSFVRGLSGYAVSIGLVVDGRRQVGVVHHTPTGDTYAAVRGAGAYRNGDRISVTDESELEESLIAAGFSRFDADDERTLRLFRHFIDNTLGVRRHGSSALSLCRVAAGTFEGFYHTRLGTWDVAAGTLLVEEAGGTVTDLQGDDSESAILDGTILATNGGVHQDLLAVCPAGDQ